jgi:hypothetical protein
MSHTWVSVKALLAFLQHRPRRVRLCRLLERGAPIRWQISRADAISRFGLSVLSVDPSRLKNPKPCLIELLPAGTNMAPNAGPAGVYLTEH